MFQLSMEQLADKIAKNAQTLKKERWGVRYNRGMPLPSVFIGSSREQLPTARALRDLLGDSVEATVWDEASFELNESIFGGLLKAADQFDFAVFVFDADDVAQVRKTSVRIVRDNVLFELGLFTGRMGAGRTFWIRARGAKASHIPADLAGIVHLEYGPARPRVTALRTALKKPVERLSAEISKLGRRGDRIIDELDAARVLCVASSQYSKPKFAQDIAEIQSNFPPRSVTSKHGLAGAALFTFLSEPKSWDIIHLAMFVDPDTGDLLVPDTRNGDSSRSVLPVRGVESLIRTSGAKLVVIVTCDSLVLATRIAPITNVIAGYKPIDVSAALDWSAVFYRLLTGGCALSEAFTRAQALTDPGLVLLAKRDFRLTLSAAPARERARGSRSPRVRGRAATAQTLKNE